MRISELAGAADLAADASSRVMAWIFDGVRPAAGFLQPALRIAATRKKSRQEREKLALVSHEREESDLIATSLRATEY